MKEYVEQGKNGQLTLPPSVSWGAEAEEGDLFKTVINEYGSMHLIHLIAEQRELIEQSHLKDIP